MARDATEVGELGPRRPRAAIGAQARRRFPASRTADQPRSQLKTARAILLEPVWRQATLIIREVEVQARMPDGDHVVVHVADGVAARRVGRRPDVATGTGQRPFAKIVKLRHASPLMPVAAVDGGPGRVLVQPLLGVAVAPLATN